MRAPTLITVTVLAGLGATAVSGRGPSLGGLLANRQAQTSVLDRPMSIRDAARTAPSGEYRFTVDPNPDSEIPNVESIVRASDAIAIGETVDNQCHLSNNGAYITTDFRVRVTEPLFGSLRPNDTLVLSVMGGRVEFGDGTAAQMGTTHFKRPNDGERFVLFLKQFPARLVTAAMAAWANGAPVYVRTAGPMGIVGLPKPGQPGAVEFRGRKTDPVALAHRHSEEQTFVNAVREAIRTERKAERR
jgi:hypothetical protein